MSHGGRRPWGEGFEDGWEELRPSVAAVQAAPSPARVYDHLLGGKDHYENDRALAERMLRLQPRLIQAARQNRRFVARTVRSLARAGYAQFLDIGCGLPTADDVHRIAVRERPGVRMVCVDNDPIVLAHGRALLTESGVATFIQGDLYEPEKIFSDPALLELIDLKRPVGIILAAIIHHVPDERDPKAVVRRLHDFVAPGSYFMLTHLHDSGDDPRVAEAKKILQTGLGGSYFRSREQITGFLDGLTLLEPGVVHVTEWRPNGPPGPLEHPLHTQMVAGLARKDS